MTTSPTTRTPARTRTHRWRALGLVLCCIHCICAYIPAQYGVLHRIWTDLRIATRGHTQSHNPDWTIVSSDMSCVMTSHIARTNTSHRHDNIRTRGLPGLADLAKCTVFPRESQGNMLNISTIQYCTARMWGIPSHLCVCVCARVCAYTRAEMSSDIACARR